MSFFKCITLLLVKSEWISTREGLVKIIFRLICRKKSRDTKSRLLIGWSWSAESLYFWLLSCEMIFDWSVKGLWKGSTLVIGVRCVICLPPLIALIKIAGIIHRFLLFTEICVQFINASDWLDSDKWNAHRFWLVWEWFVKWFTVSGWLESDV